MKKIFGRKSSSYFNDEAYPDPTAFYGMKSAMDEDKQLHRLVNVVRDIVDMSDFEIVGRIEFRHKKTGKIYK